VDLSQYKTKGTSQAYLKRALDRWHDGGIIYEKELSHRLKCDGPKSAIFAISLLIRRTLPLFTMSFGIEFLLK
jgi:hypothetical protein